MRAIFPLFLLSLSIWSCTQAPPLPQPAARPFSPPVASLPVAKPSAPAPPPAPVLPLSPPKVTRAEISGITFEGVSFDSRSHRLAVVDQPGGPASRFADSRSAAASRNGIAAANAGFFTPEGTPLGKLISSGKPAGSWNGDSSLGSGIFREDPSGNLSLSRRETVSPSAPQRELLQAGPMLVENGRTVGGLNAEKPAIRIFLLWNGQSGWWLGRSSACTLAQLGTALGSGSPAGWPVRHALNLDGGRSSDLWASGNVTGGPLNFRSLFNKPVRNFLVIVPR